MITKDIIFIWAGTVSSIPTGYSRVTDMDGKYPKVTAHATNPNTTGGNTSHTHSATASHAHTANAHTHTISVGNVYDPTLDDRSGVDTLQEHNHSSKTSANSSGGNLSSVASTYTSVTNDPPYYKVIYIKSDGTVGVPNGAIALYDYLKGSLPSNWYSCDGNNSTPNLIDKYLRGAGTGENAGATGGSLTNAHALSHAHSVANHSHSNITSLGVYNPTFCDSWGGGTGGHISNLNYAHTHTVYTNDNVDTISSANATITCSETVEPAYKKLMAIKNNTSRNDTPLGIIGLWLGLLKDIPRGWKLCDGSGNTIDMRGYHIKIGTSGQVGTSGGSNTHSHSSQTHTHTSTGHTHSGYTNGHVMAETTSRGHNVGYTTHKFVDASDTHYVTVLSRNGSYQNGTTSSNSQPNEPQFRTVALIKYVGVRGGSTIFI